MSSVVEPIRCVKCQHEVTLLSYTLGVCPAAPTRGHHLTEAALLALALRPRLEEGGSGSGN